MKILVCLVSAFFLTSADFYSFSKLNKNKLSWPLKILAFLLLIGVLFINGFIGLKYIKSILTVAVFYIINKYIYKNELKDAVLYCFYTLLYSVVAEMIFTCLFLFFNNEGNILDFSSTYFGMIFSNFAISFIFYLLVQFKSIFNFFVNFRNRVTTVKERDLIIYLLTIFVTAYVLFVLVYFKYYTSKIQVYVIISVMFLIYTLIFVYLLSSINNYNKEKEKYTLSTKSLLEYEDILDKYRVANHENKNNLLMLSNMTNIKDVKKYVNQILQLKEQDNSNLFAKVLKVPEGGLRAVIYSKILEMDSEKIDYSLIIDRKIKVKYFIDISSKDSLDICNILNVFLDNAIQYVLTTKKPSVLIEMNLLDNNDIEIVVSNNCEEKVDVNAIKKNGYTTKSIGHGYGLTLVKEILSSNANLDNITEYSDNVFTQKLIIKR